MDSTLSISFSKVDIFQRDKLILTGVDLDVRKGEMLYLVGRVGSGKTSLIKTINAELPVESGSANVTGVDLRKIKQSEVPYFRRKLGIVFQDFKLLSDRSVYKNLEFVLKATGWTDKEAIQQRINEMLDEVGMQNHAKKMPHQLSGGEQQRVVIARAILNNPEIILADEPTGNLDDETSDQIMQLFKTIHSEGKTVIIATHDNPIIKKYPARTLVCKDGNLNQLENKEMIDFKSIIE